MAYLKPRLKSPVRLVVALASLALLLAVPAAAQADWGAIALDPISGKYGVAYNYDSAKAAQERARNECGTKHCKAAVWVRNGYAALVQKRKNGLYFAGYGRSKHAAFRKALRRANESNARRVTWVFSGY